MNDSLLVAWFAANMLMLPVAMWNLLRLACAVCRAHVFFTLLMIIMTLLVTRRFHTFVLDLGRDYAGLSASEIIDRYLTPTTISLMVMLTTFDAARRWLPHDSRTEIRDA